MVNLEQVTKIRQQLPGIGTDKLHHLLTDFLAENQIKFGRDKLYDLLRESHLLCHKKRRRARTTNSQHPFYKYANVVKDLPLICPNHLCVSDITYIRTGNDFSYLSLITAAYSHKIVGWAVGVTLHTKVCLPLKYGYQNATKGKKAFMADLKPVYQAFNQTKGYENLLKLDENWGKKLWFHCRAGITSGSLDTIMKDEIYNLR